MRERTSQFYVSGVKTPLHTPVSCRFTGIFQPRLPGSGLPSQERLSAILFSAWAGIRCSDIFGCEIRLVSEDVLWSKDWWGCAQRSLSCTTMSCPCAAISRSKPLAYICHVSAVQVLTHGWHRVDEPLRMASRPSMPSFTCRPRPPPDHSQTSD